jgi:hypothetical protein
MDLPAAVEELIASLKRQIAALQAEWPIFVDNWDRTVRTVPSRLRATG